MPDLVEIIGPLLGIPAEAARGILSPASQGAAVVRDDAVCHRLMTIPGVGPVTSLAFTSTIDIPARFRNSRAVGPALGLTPVLNQSGESHRVGRVSLCGDAMMRTCSTKRPR